MFFTIYLFFNYNSIFLYILFLFILFIFCLYWLFYIKRFNDKIKTIHINLVNFQYILLTHLYWFYKSKTITVMSSWIFLVFPFGIFYNYYNVIPALVAAFYSAWLIKHTGINFAYLPFVIYAAYCLYSSSQSPSVAMTIHLWFLVN